MNKKHISHSNSLIKKDDRTNDGNLRPEARERTLALIKDHLRYAGRVNISKIAELVGLSRQTTKKLVNEVLAEWQEDMQDQSLVQAKWFETVLDDLDESPETFDKEKAFIVQLKAGLLSKMSALQKLALKEDSSLLNLYLVKKGSAKELPKPKPP